jgi:hypothetical protein
MHGKWSCLLALTGSIIQLCP